MTDFLKRLFSWRDVGIAFWCAFYLLCGTQIRLDLPFWFVIAFLVVGLVVGCAQFVLALVRAGAG